MLLSPILAVAIPAVTFRSLLAEMRDRDALARWPVAEYQSLQASSYNRDSVSRSEPGWFADSDGTGFIRQDEHGEYVLMEHIGPGCITKIWTPFFYYDFGNLKGPNVRIYLDGNPTPVFDESLINLVTGRGSIPRFPYAAYTARAGNLYLPIPFAKSARVTMKERPFYNIINYRAYPHGTKVQTFEPNLAEKSVDELEWTRRSLAAKINLDNAEFLTLTIDPRQSAVVDLPTGPNAVQAIACRIHEADEQPFFLRSTVLTGVFDDEETIWAPVGDFFSCSDRVHPYSTWMRSVEKSGMMTSRWTMPYRRSGKLKITNHGATRIHFTYRVEIKPWVWDNRSMHFFARWRPDDIVPGTPFTDWNFVDVAGRGVYVGDAWTVLNPRRDSWWGEGDEKIYVDGAWEKGFPTHFGTGTEDYYGWAGGVLPDLHDEFSMPFLANVKVGGLDGHTQGFNICSRIRSLDAIPFKRRLRFDIESSFGTDMRTPKDLLGYSSVTFFYAFPGATHNRPAEVAAVKKPLMSLGLLRKMAGSGS